MMKKCLLFFLLLVETIVTSQTIETVFPINEIVFYPTKALIRSSKEIKLSKGQNTILINDLPVLLEENSIKFWADGEFLILDQEFKVVSKRTEVFDKYNDSVQMIDKQLSKITSLADIYQVELKEIEAYNNSMAKTDKILETGERIKWIDYVHLKKTENLNRLDSLKFQREKLMEMKVEYSETIKKLSLINTRGQLRIQLSVANNSSYIFQLSFIIKDAGWEPIYEIDYNDENYSINLLKKASFIQNTGLDMVKVSTFVSEDMMKSKFERPLMFPQYYSYQKNEEKNLTYAMQSTAGSLKDYGIDKEEVSSSNQFENYIGELNKEISKQKIDTSRFINISNRNNFLVHEIPIGVFELNSGQKLAWPIHNIKISPRMSNVLIPCKDRNAYIIAKIPKQNYFTANSASINLYKNHQYMGEAVYFTDALADSVLIPLSVNDLIVSEFVEAEEASSERFFGKYKFETKSHLIAIKNHNSYEVELNVFDQIPVGSKSIDVATVDLSNGKYNPLNGRIEWILKIKPGSTRILRVVFAVKYLKNNKLYINN